MCADECDPVEGLFQKCILHLQPFVRAINRVYAGEPDEIENIVYKTAAETEAELDVSMIAFQDAFNAFFVNEGIPVPCRLGIAQLGLSTFWNRRQ